jgi:hypothetical protein
MAHVIEMEELLHAESEQRAAVMQENTNDWLMRIGLYGAFVGPRVSVDPFTAAMLRDLRAEGRLQ